MGELFKLVRLAVVEGEKERVANLKRIADENEQREWKERFEADSVVAKIPELVRCAVVNGKNCTGIYRIPYESYKDTTYKDTNKNDESVIGPFLVRANPTKGKTIFLRGVARKIYEQLIGEIEEVYFIFGYDDRESWYEIWVGW